MKLLNRAYSGPIIKILRTGAEQAEAFVYPDQNGKVSLEAPLEIFSGSSQATSLGSFLCQPQYTPDPVFGGSSPNVTAVATVMYDQSSNANNLTAAEGTAPFICSNGTIYNTEWGMSLNMDGGRGFSGSVMSESFTAHYRVQFDSSTSTKYFFKQTDNALYAKMTNLYVDEAIGTSSAIVLVNEDYYSNYTTENINLTEDRGQLITLEIDVASNTLSDPPSYTIENLGYFHTAIIYNEVDKHVRRHKTNQILSEDIELLNDKLKKFSPQSFYNLFYGAKAVFGMFSFAGLLNENPVRLIRAFRDYGNNYLVYADVYANNSGYIDFDSPVDNITGPNNTVFSGSQNLGQFLAHPSYGDPDNLGESDASVYRWYSQSLQSSGDVYAQTRFLNTVSSPRFYNSATRTLDAITDDGICGLNFKNSFTDSFDKCLEITPLIEAQSVFLVYRNFSGNTNFSTTGISGLTSHPLNQGISVYAKNGFPGFNEETFQAGVGVYDLEQYRGTTAGLDTELHTVGLYLGSSPQRLVVDDTEYDIDGVRTTPLEGYPNSFKFKELGAANSFTLQGNLLAAIYYEDDRYAQKQEIQDYMNILFKLQNVPTTPVIDSPYIATHISDVAENSPTSTDPFQFYVDLVANPLHDSIAANDLLVVVLTYDARSYGDTSPGTTPAGWTKLFDMSTANDTDLGSTVYYKLADGNEGVTALFEIDNPNGDIEHCIWNYFKIKGAATTGNIIEYSTPLGALDSVSVTATAVNKDVNKNNLAIAFGAVDNGFAEGWSISGSGWAGITKEVTRSGGPTSTDIVAVWSYKLAPSGTTDTADAILSASAPLSNPDGDKVAFQIMINE